MFLGNINQTRPSKRISAVNNTRRAECRQDQRITALEKEVSILVSYIFIRIENLYLFTS